MTDYAFDGKVGDIILIGDSYYSIDCSDLYQMPGNEDGLFLQKVDDEE